MRYKPHDYQKYAINFIKEHPIAAILLGFDGMPDRIVLLPGRHFGFVEVKAPGKMPRPLQVSRHRLMEKLGFSVYVLDGPEKIGGILDEIQAT